MHHREVTVVPACFQSIRMTAATVAVTVRRWINHVAICQVFFSEPIRQHTDYHA